MTGDGDALRKRMLFDAWMAEHGAFSMQLAQQGEAIHRRTVLARLTSLAGRQKAPEYVYVLTERRPQEVTPAYVGKTRSPVTRWSQHLAGLAAGEGNYARWRQRFLREGHETVRFDLELLVVGETQVQFPPLPGFPSTIGAVEYQLVGLAADAYPLRLLNHEGQAR
ncbi:GIY-YIG nuclease family protein [Deinococcus sp. QL22]|uniref:GIY-YIG nuclease family protein n=1 Tax=Deinococcus sp. QL22 TaxID=2939437 RepID=UPI00201788C3|nr:GIY-YIG nuclease family protein [Deinococcus sp. QL22]UQN08817.1 GIY-YIG nuclease family protein [Deinococcus sp. QL22]